MTHRWLPWALASVLALPYLLAATWDAAFEALPPNTESVSLGDDRIRDFKLEVRERGEEEHCWATPGTGCTTTDNGTHREGSAMAFVETAAPAALNNPAATALGAAHAGRIWLDNDGPDNVDANNDDNRLSVWTGAAWETFRWEALSGINLTAIANGEILKYDGTNLVDQTVATLITADRATFSANQAFTNGACGGCTVNSSPNHAGGSDTNNYPEVTVPSTPAGVTWDIQVFGRIHWKQTSADNGNIVCSITSDTNDADTFLNTVTVSGQMINDFSNGDERGCQLFGLLRGVTAGNRYAFRLTILDTVGAADFTTNATATGDANMQGTSFNEIVAEIRPRTLF